MARREDPEHDVDPLGIPSALALEFVRQAPFLAGSSERLTALATAPSTVAPWPHQAEVVRTAVSRHPQGFLFCDEVGLGKTVEAGLALRSLWIARRVRRALLLVPAALLRQWQEELHEKFALPVLRFDGDVFVDVFGVEHSAGDGNPWSRHDLVLASSQLARRRERRAELLAAEPWDLLLVDEAHHARRRHPEAEGFRPNRLLELLAGRSRAADEGSRGDEASPETGHEAATGLVHRSRCVWLLTATPMQIHPVELEDLLGLVGAPRPGDAGVEARGGNAADEADAGGEAWRRQVFRHTRSVLRRYRREGLLDAAVPVRRPENVWIEMDPAARAVYRRIESYLSLFYRRYEAERRGLGFVMTVYRRRLTSSFEAIRRSLLRRRERLASGDSGGSGDSGDSGDAGELDLPSPGSDAPGLFDAAAGADELAHLESFLGALSDLGSDPKEEQLRADLRRILAERDRVLVFTQYLDTLDRLREVLGAEWSVACWSGRGGEVLRGGAWTRCGKEELKAAFGRGEIQVLLATDAASEGLNLQSCGVLIHYDMPWNPMRAEQRIGRIDRIGQRHEEIWVRSYFYADTVEAEVYRRLADRIRWFEEVVGTLQPILQQVGEAVGEVAMLPPDARRRPLEERLEALGRRVEEHRRAPTVDLGDDLGDDDARRDPPSATAALAPAVTPAEVEEIMRGALEVSAGRSGPDASLRATEPGVYRLRWRGETHRVTFRPEVYDAHPYTTRLLTWGDPLFDRLVDGLVESLEGGLEGGLEESLEERPTDGGPPGHGREAGGRWSTEEPGGVGVYRSERPSPVTLFLGPEGEAATLEELRRLAQSAPAVWRPDEEAEAASRFSALRRRALRVRERIEAERRLGERGRRLRTGADLLRRLALLELVEAENPGLFDAPLPWGFGVRAVRELARHGPPLAELLERLEPEGLPAAQPDDAFYLEARRHRRGWRERRRRALVDRADDCLQRLRALERAEEEARRRLEEPAAGAGHLDRRWFRAADGPAPPDDAPRLLDADQVEPFVDAVPALGGLADASRRLLDAAEEGLDPLAEIRRHPSGEDWLADERAAPRRFAARTEDDAMSPRAPAGTWCLFELETGRAPRDGDLLLVRVAGEALLRRFQRRGRGLLLAADLPDAAAGTGSWVLDDPDPEAAREAVQVLARFVGRI